MPAREPSLFVLVPGPFPDVAPVLDVLGAANVVAAPRGEHLPRRGEVGVEVVESPRGFGPALASGRGGALPEDLFARLDRCRHGLLMEVGGRLDQVADTLSAVGRALRDAGGVAVRMEASGGASPWDPWLERLDARDPRGLYEAGVVLVGEGDGTIFTCGMQQFDLPEAQIASCDPSEAVRWLDAFCTFQIAETPPLGSGHTFRPDQDAEPRWVERWPDHRHPPADGRHNPFGVWRLLPEGESRLQVRDPVPTVIPPLVAMLAAHERRGEALTREDVEALVTDAPRVPVRLKDARARERSRGYADIEPELAWEQWQLIRANR